MTNNKSCGCRESVNHGEQPVINTGIDTGENECPADTELDQHKQQHNNYSSEENTEIINDILHERSSHSDSFLSVRSIRIVITSHKQGESNFQLILISY